MKNRQWALFLFCCIIIFSVKLSYAQQDSLYARWAEFLEDDAELIERLQQLTDNPVNLNSAERNDFAKIPFLSSNQIDCILEYRNQHKKFKSRRPLRKILGKELYPLLKPFFTIKVVKKNKGYLKQKFILPVDPGSAAHKYLGEPWANSGKLYFARGTKLKMGMITQKDVGEQSLLDYLSGYVAYRGDSWQAITGSYHFRFGHGLAFANPFANQKSAMVLNPLRSLKSTAGPSLSSAENSGLFGISLNSQPANGLDLTLFGSIQNLDARMNRENEQVIGIDYDGYHRTSNELNAKNQLTERICGLSVSKLITPRLSSSILLCHYRYSPEIHFERPYVSESDLRRQYYHFSGDRLSQISLHYDGNYKNLSASGEICTSDMGSPGYSQKVLITKERVQFGAAYWWLSKNYQAPHGGVFNHSGTFPQAQQGLYLAVQTELAKGLTIKAYKFFTKDLWRGYFNTLPQIKEEWLMETSYAIPNKTIVLRIRNKSQTQTSAENLTAASDFRQTIYRFQYSWNPDKQLSLKTRIALTRINEANEDGMYIFQDIKYRLNRFILLYSRITFFQTSSFKSALYEYENDLPGSYANYPLFGQGHKWYVMIRSVFSEHFRLWMKLRYYKRTSLPDQTSLLNRELRFQLDLII